jgi:energy-coupling factor transport system permease protein
MSNLAAVSKLLGALMISLAALITNSVAALSLLAGMEIAAIILAGKTKDALRPVAMLIVFAAFLYLIQILCGSPQAVSIGSALKMFVMAVSVFFMLLTTKTQQITAALVQQCRLPYQYAFMVTAVLRFVPDVLKESQAVREAQACRGFMPSKNPFKRLADYMMIIKPMVFRAIARSENMAVSLEMRGFARSGKRTFIAATQVQAKDVAFLTVLFIICGAVVKFI